MMYMYTVRFLVVTVAVASEMRDNTDGEKLMTWAQQEGSTVGFRFAPSSFQPDDIITVACENLQPGERFLVLDSLLGA